MTLTFQPWRFCRSFLDDFSFLAHLKKAPGTLDTHELVSNLDVGRDVLLFTLLVLFRLLLLAPKTLVEGSSFCELGSAC